MHISARKLTSMFVLATPFLPSAIAGKRGGPPPPPAGAPDNVTGPFYGSGNNLATIVGTQVAFAYGFAEIVDNNKDISRDDAKRMPGFIPRGRDGSCFGDAIDVVWIPWVVGVNNIQKALPQIEGDAAKAGGMVGNTNATGCTHLYQSTGPGKNLQVDYCGLGNATFADFNASMQVLMGNCSFSDHKARGSSLQGRVHVPFWDHDKGNWIEVRKTSTDKGHQ